jgi:hypothetical protein
MLSCVSTPDPTTPNKRTHRAQIAMTPEMFKELRVMAALQGTTVTALVMEAIKQTYPNLSDK